VGWIILGVIVVIAIVIGVFWWINREPEPKPVPQQVVQQPVAKEPEPEPEPEPIVNPEPVRKAGLFEINEPTGRYHVIVASSIDRDLVMDYGKKLAKNGMTCNVLAPRGNKKFHRLSVADFVSLNDAALKSEQLKSEFGQEVWVIRY
jgi:cell division septation protein DedD